MTEKEFAACEASEVRFELELLPGEGYYCLIMRQTAFNKPLFKWRFDVKTIQAIVRDVLPPSLAILAGIDVVDTPVEEAGIDGPSGQERRP